MLIIYCLLACDGVCGEWRSVCTHNIKGLVQKYVIWNMLFVSSSLHTYWLFSPLFLHKTARKIGLGLKRLLLLQWLVFFCEFVDFHRFLPLHSSFLMQLFKMCIKIHYGNLTDSSATLTKNIHGVKWLRLFHENRVNTADSLFSLHVRQCVWWRNRPEDNVACSDEPSSAESSHCWSAEGPPSHPSSHPLPAHKHNMEPLLNTSNTTTACTTCCACSSLLSVVG